MREHRLEMLYHLVMHATLLMYCPLLWPQNGCMLSAQHMELLAVGMGFVGWRLPARVHRFGYFIVSQVGYWAA